MDITGLNIGILHSLIGKNDGVSIVIDQTIAAMSDQLNIPLDNMYFLAGHSAPRMQTMTDDIFWHRNEQNKYILELYSMEEMTELDEYIQTHATYAKNKIAEFIEKNKLDVFIIHNSCHPSNFVFAVAAGMYFKERREEGLILPRYLLWWHDSHFERERFSKPSSTVKKYLESYVPGPDVDGIVFINSQQALIGPKYYEAIGKSNSDQFFERKTCVIPNTCDVHWDWHKAVDNEVDLVPPQDQYNKTFFKDIGLIDELERRGTTLEDSVLLLQHTRVVQRKRIDHAIKFAFALEKKYKKEGHDKHVVLLVSGHSGDEHDPHRTFLEEYYAELIKEDPTTGDRVVLIFAEHLVFPSREVLVNRKFYRFSDIPDLVAAAGGMATYFSEVEGYGNNLLEVMSAGLPVIINEYEIYETDIKELGFDLVCTKEGNITEEAVDASYKLLTDKKHRWNTVKHNLETLESKLNHGVMAKGLGKILENLFRYR